jgi:hypothetical protein
LVSVRGGVAGLTAAINDSVPGSAGAAVAKRASSGWRLRTRSTLDTFPICGSLNAKRMAGVSPAARNAAWTRSTSALRGSLREVTISVTNAVGIAILL